MNKHTFKSIIIALFSLAIILSIFLGVNIYQLSNTYNAHQPSKWRSLTINFKRPISSNEERQIKMSLYQFKDLKRVHFNQRNTKAVLTVKHSPDIRFDNARLLNQLPHGLKKISRLEKTEISQ